MFKNNNTYLNEILSYFFKSLNDKNIKYCVWGNYTFLPESLNGSDLDIVIHGKNKIEFKNCFDKFINQFNGKVVSFFKTHNTVHYRIIGIYNNSPWGIMIDVIFDEFYYKDKIYFPSKWVWSIRKNHNGIIVNDIGFSYLAGFLKELLHKGFIKDRYLINVIAELKTNSFRYEIFLNEVYGIDFTKILLKEFEKKVELINIKLLRKLALKSLKSNEIAFNTKGFQKYKRIIRQPGFTIAFLGTDGSGKSTIIENIKPPLIDGFHNAIYYEHMRPNKLPSIARLLGSKEEFNSPVTNPHGSKTSGFLGSLFRWSYYMLDYTFGFYLKIWPKKAIRSCVWIFDRYYYDYLIDPKRARIKLPQWIIKFGQLLIPEPDLIICLGTDAQVIHERKPELTLEEVERQVCALKKFCESHKRAVWIDTGKDIDTSTSDAIEAIINMMAKRFEALNLSK